MTLVHLEIDDGIALLTLDNPPVNVFSVQMGKDLRAAVAEIERTGNVYTVVVTGAGEKAFVAGGDIKEFPHFFEQDSAAQAATVFHDALQALHSIAVPTVATIRGHALGGGCELALACDFRIAEQHCKLGFPEITLGVFPGAGGTQRLSRLIGVARAKRMIFTGEPIQALEALSIGLVDEVTEQGNGMEATKRFLTKFADKSRVALRFAKQAIDGGLHLSLDEGLKLETQLFGEVFRTADAREGVAAFIAKRRPTFTHQ